MRLVAATALMVSLGSGGCSLSFKFGRAPLAPPAPTKAEACVWNHAIRIRPAWSSTQSEHNPDARVNRARKSRAWTFFQGGRRISAEVVLRTLRDARLQRDYRGIWAAAARRGSSRVLGGSTALAAAVVLGIAGGAMVHGWPPPHDASLSKAESNRVIAGFVLIGVAVVASVVLPILMKVGYRDVRAAEAFRTVFLSTDHESAMRKAVARYNLRVKKACRQRFSAAP